LDKLELMQTPVEHASSRREFLRRLTLGAALLSTADLTRLVATVATPPRKLGVALLGLGYYSNGELGPALRQTKLCQLSGVISGSPEKAARWAKDYNLSPKNLYNYETMDRLADNPDIDIVYVVTPNALHAEHTIRAARAGKHVLCEKPLALSEDEVDRIAAAGRESGVVIAEAFMYRHHPQTPRLKALVDDGAIGAVRFARGSFSFPLSRPNDVRLRPEWGGGCLWDVGCYPLSLARFVLGAEPLEVFGSAVSGATGVDETFAGQLVFPGGVLVQVDGGFRSPFRAEFEVAGTEGVIRLRHPFKPRPELPLQLERDGEVTTFAVEPADRYRLEVEDLAAAVVTGRPPRVSLAESRGNVAAIVALLRSAREGRPIRL
jgi:predicted dehydrogenase